MTHDYANAESMSDEELEEIEQVTLASSEVSGYFPLADDDGDVSRDWREQMDWIEGLMREGEVTRRPLWIVTAKDDEVSGYDCSCAAITGNGPKSKDNAKFFEGSRRVILRLIAEVRRLKNQLAERDVRIEDMKEEG